MWQKISLILLLSVGLSTTAVAQDIFETVNDELMSPKIVTQVDKVEINQYAAARQIKARGRRTFIFNPRTASWAAYDERGRIVKSGVASGGAGYCADVKRSCRTPVGTFSVYNKGPADCRSSKYPLPNGGARMPHCMFFRGGYAIHGSPNVPKRNVSHGCIRVKPEAARWLYNNFMRVGTVVVVRPY